jgi:DNA processing protein
MSQAEERETAAVLALNARRDLPWSRVAGMVEEEGSALALLARLDREADPTLFEAHPSVSLETVQDRLDEWRAEGMHVITVLDEDYPLNLRLVHDRPAALFVRGHLQDTDERSVAVVGTRNPTERGLQQARDIARGLVAAGYVVVSGLAQGIDTAAHTATLAASGRTIAVIGTGLRHAFPKANAELQARLGSESAVVSQFWPDQGARRHTFPMRNAVMSGLARATVVVEARGNSGARMQARLALEHGRPVFLLRSLLDYDWARDYAQRAGTYVVVDADEAVDRLERLYSDELTLSG